MPLSDRPFGVVTVGQQVPPIPGENVQASNPAPLPATLAVTSATETIVPSALSSLVPLGVAVRPDTNLEQRPFDVWASGIIKTLNTTNVTIKLYSGTSLTVASNTLLGSSGAIAQNTATASWNVHAEVQFDSVTGTLVGKVAFYVNKTVVAAVTLSNFPTGFLNVGNPNANPPTVSNLPQFLLSLTSSAADGTHATTMTVAAFSCG